MKQGIICLRQISQRLKVSKGLIHDDYHIFSMYFIGVIDFIQSRRNSELLYALFTLSHGISLRFFDKQKFRIVKKTDGEPLSPVIPLDKIEPVGYLFVPVALYHTKHQ